MDKITLMCWYLLFLAVRSILTGTMNGAEDRGNKALADTSRKVRAGIEELQDAIGQKFIGDNACEQPEWPKEVWHRVQHRLEGKLTPEELQKVMKGLKGDGK